MLYRIGLNPECPVHHVTSGGLCFPKRTESVSGYGSDTQRNVMQGAVVNVEPEVVALAMERAKTKFIRSTRGKKFRAWTVSSETPYFKALPDDVPVTKFMFVKQLQENPHTRAKVFPTVEEKPPPAPPPAPKAEVKPELGKGSKRK